MNFSLNRSRYFARCACYCVCQRGSVRDDHFGSVKNENMMKFKCSANNTSREGSDGKHIGT